MLLKISFTLRVDDPPGTVYTYPLRQASAMGFHVGAMKFPKTSAYGDAHKALLSMKQQLNIYEDGHSREARTRTRTRNVRLAIIVPEYNGTWTSCVVSQLDLSTMNEKVETVRENEIFWKSEGLRDGARFLWLCCLDNNRFFLPWCAHKSPAPLRHNPTPSTPHRARHPFHTGSWLRLH